MAKLINIESKKEIEIPDNCSLIPQAEEVDVIFACQDGLCTSCRMEIIEGMENLTEPTQNEKDTNLYKNERLACQCKIKSGTVKMRIA
ncbi:MAG: ferredoxin-4 [archaeon]|jgi:ferredoxin